MQSLPAVSQSRHRRRGLGAQLGMKKAKGEAGRKKNKERKATVKGKSGRIAEKKSTGKKTVAEMVQDKITAQPPEPSRFRQVRKNIAALVGSAAEEIARNAMKVAKKGQLAPAKYFFEVAGLYPETAETASEPEDSLAYTLC